MELKWTNKALSNLARLYEFLKPVNQQAAAQTIQMFTKTPEKLRINPRMGEQRFEFKSREVRRIMINHYEMRYEIQALTIYILRLWHTREDR